MPMKRSQRMTRTAMNRLNENAATYMAMLKAGWRRKPKLAPAEFARRLAQEQVLQQRRYSDAFSLWRSCRLKHCRRLGRCWGDATACVKRAINSVPAAEQTRARARILKATPANIGAPERQARRSMPRDFYE
jgi:hypothetical protein